MTGRERLKIEKTRILDHNGTLYNSIKDSAKGSWNSFDIFQNANDPKEMLAVRRLRDDILADRFKSKRISPEELQERFDDEFNITQYMALCMLAPQLREVLYEIHPEYILKNTNKPLKSYIYIPDAFDGSLHFFIFKSPQSLTSDGNLQESATNIANNLVDLCLQFKELDYCNLDVKFGNIVMKLSNNDIRFIDFDPGYMRSLDADKQILDKLQGEYGLNTEQSKSFLRLFYGVIMIIFLKLECCKYLNRDLNSMQTSILKEFNKVFLKSLRRISVPMGILLSEPILKHNYPLIEGIIDRCLQYNYMDDRLHKIPKIKSAAMALTKLQNTENCNSRLLNQSKRTIKELKRPYIIPALKLEIKKLFPKSDLNDFPNNLNAPVNYSQNPRPFDELSWHDHRKVQKALDKLDSILENPEHENQQIISQLTKIFYK